MFNFYSCNCFCIHVTSRGRQFEMSNVRMPAVGIDFIGRAKRNWPDVCPVLAKTQYSMCTSAWTAWISKPLVSICPKIRSFLLTWWWKRSHVANNHSWSLIVCMYACSNLCLHVCSDQPQVKECSNYCISRARLLGIWSDVTLEPRYVVRMATHDEVMWRPHLTGQWIHYLQQLWDTFSEHHRVYGYMVREHHQMGLIPLKIVTTNLKFNTYGILSLLSRYAGGL